MIFVVVPVLAVVFSVGLLVAVARLRPDGMTPHAALAPVPNVLASVVVLLSSFEVVTGWANRASSHPLHPPAVVFVLDVLAAASLLAYPAVAGLPYTWRNRILVGMFALPVGAVLALAWDLQR
ncbi:hypothetical protein AB0F92_42255 [Kitasatospora aureofaciens]|uniref:hypothetical protein n=1 Tax=Kitasatospora aureofaciens TaxID=1894 RepID=UPI00092B9DC9|nr:hypothetical protein CP971_33845 [Streptomyces viridifaciens]UKZ03756.1 hypothetical protein BOQ63_006665 [Streptomyces viridifaciens]